VKRKDYQKKYQQGWYAQNGTSRREQVRNRRRALKQRFRDYKRTLSCEECGLSGEESPWALDFHHHEAGREEKVTSVSHLVSGGYGWEKIMDEVSKCTVICANCHRAEHYREHMEKVEAGLTGIELAPTRIDNPEFAKKGRKKQRRRHRVERRNAREAALKDKDEENLSGPKRKE
tara:strand:+ start:5239 stop:5763 length:525 start_codon:yes stop_codon:yes gene_type:complete